MVSFCQGSGFFGERRNGISLRHVWCIRLRLELRLDGSESVRDREEYLRICGTGENLSDRAALRYSGLTYSDLQSRISASGKRLCGSVCVCVAGGGGICHFRTLIEGTWPDVLSPSRLERVLARRSL